MSGWIRCEDRMPEKGVQVWGAVYGTDVIVARDTETVLEAMRRSYKENRRAVVCEWWGPEDGWYNNGCYMVVQPRLWMPIEWPQVPEEEE